MMAKGGKKGEHPSGGEEAQATFYLYKVEGRQGNNFLPKKKGKRAATGDPKREGGVGGSACTREEKKRKRIPNAKQTPCSSSPEEGRGKERFRKNPPTKKREGVFPEDHNPESFLTGKNREASWKKGKKEN